MNPPERPNRGWLRQGCGDPAQGGFSVAQSLPALRTPGMTAPPLDAEAFALPVPPGTVPDSAPRGAAGVEAVPGPIGLPARGLPGPINAFTFNKSEFGFFTALSGTVGQADVLILPQPDTHRIYLLIVNPDPVNTLSVSFGAVATAANAFQVPPNFGSLGFDARVPQDDIHLIGSAPATQYQLLYSNRGEF